MKNQLTVFLVLLTLAACRPSPKRHFVLHGAVFGTSYTIQYFDGLDRSASVQHRLDSLFAAVNHSLSTYDPESDISKINRGETGIATDGMFRDVFTLSKEVHRKTEGYFDPTVGMLRNAYGFGGEAPLTGLSQAKLDSMMEFVGFDKVSLAAGGFVEKARPEIYLDFNAVAKGYAVDRVGEELEGMGIGNFWVEIGGEVTARGKNLGRGAWWRAGLEDFQSGIQGRKLMGSVDLINASIAGSGNYRGVRMDSATGIRHVHTIDPQTGSAIPSDILSVHVMSRSCARADAYATAFMAMGFEKAMAILPELEAIEVFLVYLSDSGTVASYASPAFAHLQ